MKQKHTKPLNPNDWNSLPLTTQIYITWRIFKTTHLPTIKNTVLKKLIRVELWLFPPLGFFACYKAISLLFPKNHPMTPIAIPGTAIMFMALAMLLLRPPRKKIAHWITIK